MLCMVLKPAYRCVSLLYELSLYVQASGYAVARPSDSCRVWSADLQRKAIGFLDVKMAGFSAAWLLLSLSSLLLTDAARELKAGNSFAA